MTDTTNQNGSAVANSDSILNTIKKLIGYEPEITSYDVDLIVHINTTFLTLQQLGVGPATGFAITGAEETWTQYIGADNPNLNAVKSYISTKVRLVFDPPATSFVIQAMEKVATELEWRLNSEAELATLEVTEP